MRHIGSKEMISFGGKSVKKKSIHAIRFRDIFYKKATSRLTVPILTTL